METQSEHIDESSDPALEAWMASDGSTHQVGNLLLMPVVLLYTGFFLGPFFTFLTAIILARRQLNVRSALILFGFSGTAWCLIGGFTVAYGTLLDWQYLQMGRAMFNLANGLASYVIVRRALAGYKVIPRTLYLTVGLAFILIIIFFLTPAKIVMVIGR